MSRLPSHIEPELPAAGDSDAAKPSDELRLEAFIPYQLSRLSNTVSGGIAQTYANRYKLSVTDWRVVAILGRFPGLAAQEVALRGALDKVAVSRSVSRLIDRELLRRDFADDDRRRSILELSDSGDALFRQIAPAALAFERALLEVLSDEERRQLSHLLDRLQKRADDLGDL